MPMSRLAAGTGATSRPFTSTDPESAVSNPATMRSAVVLPHPEGPSRATNSPGAISSESRSSARIAPNVRVSPEITTGTPPLAPSPAPAWGPAALVVLVVIGTLPSPAGQRTPSPPARRRYGGPAGRRSS